MSHAVFSLPNILIPAVLQTVRTRGYNQSSNTPTKQCIVAATEERFTLQRQRLHERCDFSLVSVRLYTRAILYPRHLSPIACTSREVASHVTSNSDVYEIDPSMQMSFLKAALYLPSTTVAVPSITYSTLP